MTTQSMRQGVASVVCKQFYHGHFNSYHEWIAIRVVPTIKSNQPRNRHVRAFDNETVGSPNAMNFGC